MNLQLVTLRTQEIEVHIGRQHIRPQIEKGKYHKATSVSLKRTRWHEIIDAWWEDKNPPQRHEHKSRLRRCKGRNETVRAEVSSQASARAEAGLAGGRPGGAAGANPGAPALLIAAVARPDAVEPAAVWPRSSRRGGAWVRRRGRNDPRSRLAIPNNLLPDVAKFLIFK